MGFLKYNDEEKKKYYSKKATAINNKYKLKGDYMYYGGVVIVNDWKRFNNIKRTIHSKGYDRDMYLLAYYVSRSWGDNHKQSINFAKDNYTDLKLKEVAHIQDVANILKNHIRIDYEDK